MYSVEFQESLKKVEAAREANIAYEPARMTAKEKEDLLAARKTPEKYGHLRVRVSGFSDFFVRLGDPIQEEIIKNRSK